MQNPFLTICLLVILMTFTLKANSDETINSFCDINVAKTETIPDPLFFGIFGPITSVLCETYSSPGDYWSPGEAIGCLGNGDGWLGKKLMKKCVESLVNCKINYADYLDRYSVKVCVTGSRVKTIELSFDQILERQCRKIKSCIERSVQTRDENLYRQAENLYTSMQCKN